ncbi:MAG: hypothetical protein JWP27_1597 [Flaviaesturariibacter sp.]|nr:hypothetical protein [Flaviaesturariibacter sp.]
MEQRLLHPDGVALGYRVSGTGPAIVLLHGFGEDGRVWTNQVDHFPGWQLIVPDLPGSGVSGMKADMSMEGLAEAVAQILDAESVSSCILVGHSMGGYITMAMAQKYPGRLAAFGLFHSSAFADSDEKKAVRSKGIDFIRQHGAAAFLKSSIPNLFSTATKAGRPELIEEQVQGNADMTDAALVAYYESMMARPDRTEFLKDATVPVLFVLGREDAAVPIADGLRQCYLPARSQVDILEASGHMGMIEEADAANRSLQRFVTWVSKQSTTT